MPRKSASLTTSCRSLLSAVPSTNLTFSSRAAHRDWLAQQATLPAGFRVGTTRFDFIPAEAPKPARMTLTLIALDRPTADFAAVFTKNAFPGAPVLVGRQRLAEPQLGAILVNNKISNVCAPGGVETAERLCASLSGHLGLTAQQILPSSTGVIGWQLPEKAMSAALPAAAAALAGGSVLPAAEGIVTTDLYPKIRSARLGEGRIVGIAKGAGMIEPNMATMLVYLLTDLVVPREDLRAILRRVVNRTFNCISVDSDTSTSDTVVALSSGQFPCPDLLQFEHLLGTVCQDLAEDVVRNGEGVHHVMRVQICGAPDAAIARALSKAIANAPLFKCALAGNDPNVGRLIQAIGKYVGAQNLNLDLSQLRAMIGGVEIFARGAFQLDSTKERQLVDHLKHAELYASASPADGVFKPTIDYPPHERCVEIQVDLGLGNGEAVVIGADLTHEYISENADYRS